MSGVATSVIDLSRRHSSLAMQSAKLFNSSSELEGTGRAVDCEA